MFFLFGFPSEFHVIVNQDTAVVISGGLRLMDGGVKVKVMDVFLTQTISPLWFFFFSSMAQLLFFLHYDSLCRL